MELGASPVPTGAGQGVCAALLEALVNLGLTDHWQHKIYITTVGGYVPAVGGKEALRHKLWSITRRLNEQSPSLLRQSGIAFRLILACGEGSD